MKLFWIVIMFATIALFVGAAAGGTYKWLGDKWGVECENYQEEKCVKPVSWQKAVYFSTQTLTTVGYGSSLQMTDDRMRLISSAFMILSAISFGTLVGILASAIMKLAR